MDGRCKTRRPDNGLLGHRPPSTEPTTLEALRQRNEALRQIIKMQRQELRQSERMFWLSQEFAAWVDEFNARKCPALAKPRTPGRSRPSLNR